MALLRFKGPEVWPLMVESLTARERVGTFVQNAEVIAAKKGISIDEAIDLLFNSDHRDEVTRILKENAGAFPPGLKLVKDEGIYLMANTPLGEGQERKNTAFAEGYDPTKEDRGDVWSRASAVSGDDFVEFIDIADWPEFPYEEEGIEIDIVFSHDTIEINFFDGRKVKPEMEATDLN